MNWAVTQSLSSSAGAQGWEVLAFPRAHEPVGRTQGDRRTFSEFQPPWDCFSAESLVKVLPSKEQTQPECRIVSAARLHLQKPPKSSRLLALEGEASRFQLVSIDAKDSHKRKVATQGHNEESASHHSWRWAWTQPSQQNLRLTQYLPPSSTFSRLPWKLAGIDLRLWARRPDSERPQVLYAACDRSLVNLKPWLSTPPSGLPAASFEPVASVNFQPWWQYLQAVGFNVIRNWMNRCIQSQCSQNIGNDCLMWTVQVQFQPQSHLRTCKSQNMPKLTRIPRKFWFSNTNVPDQKWHKMTNSLCAAKKSQFSVRIKWRLLPQVHLNSLNSVTCYLPRHSFGARFGPHYLSFVAVSAEVHRLPGPAIILWL